MTGACVNQEMTERMAGRLHSAASKLVRQLRREEDDGRLSPPRASALATIAVSGPLSLAQLAAAERVRAPTMSRIVDGLVCENLVCREIVPTDRRSVRITITAQGRDLLDESRKRRASPLTARLQSLGDSEKRALLRGVELIERIAG